MLFVKIKYLPVFELINKFLLVNREVSIYKHTKFLNLLSFILYASSILGVCYVSFFKRNDLMFFC